MTTQHGISRLPLTLPLSEENVFLSFILVELFEKIIVEYPREGEGNGSYLIIMKYVLLNKDKGSISII